jgi:glycosyltransferase involved in cell wall biosynthesis
VPSIDVIVPRYNYGRFLPSCTDSVLGQLGCEVGVLIIDGASTDDSLAIARSLAARDNRIQVLAHEKNRGHIATCNEGIEWLSADYMLLLSSQDMPRRRGRVGGAAAAFYLARKCAASSRAKEGITDMRNIF